MRTEVSGKSQAWGYQIGSVYIRKVHFRDGGMIRQIEEKVVNRLRQVTSAIKQAGANQVSVITSSAEREAAIEFAKAGAIRPATLAALLRTIATVPAVSNAVFEVLETQRILASGARLQLLPQWWPWSGDGGPAGNRQRQQFGVACTQVNIMPLIGSSRYRLSSAGLPPLEEIATPQPPVMDRIVFHHGYLQRPHWMD